MKFLLAISSLSSINPISSTFLENNFINKDAKSEIIDISKLDIKTAIVDVSSMVKYDESKLKKLIFKSLMLSNKDDKNIYDMMFNLYRGSNNDVEVDGIPEYLPEINTTQNFTLTFMGMSGIYYPGSFKDITITISNEANINVKDISEFITNNTIEDQTLIGYDKVHILSLVLAKNKGLYDYKSYLKIDEVYKNGFFLESTDNTKIKGSVFFNCNILATISTYDPNLKTNKVILNAYNSTISDSTEIVADFKFNLGLNWIKSNYNNINFNIDGEAWDNHGGYKTNIIGNLSERIENLDETNIYYNDYIGTENWMKEYASLKINVISNDTIEITLKSSVKVHATAWNALWARASMQTWINSITLS